MKDHRGNPSVCRRKPALLGVFVAVLVAMSAPVSQSAPQSPAGGPPPAAGPPAGESPAAKTPPAKVVMRVGSREVTAGQIQALVKTLPVQYQRTAAQQGLKVVGDQYSVLLALAQQAQAQGLDETPEFKAKIDLQRLQLLASDEQRKMADEAKVSPDEVNQYYGQHQKDFEEVLVRQINVRKKVASARGDSPGLPEADAKKRAEDIRQALGSGQDATKVADQYKMANVVFFAPEPRPVRHGQLPGEMDKAAWTLKDGECSEIQDNPMNLYFVQVVKHDQRSIQDVSKEIEGKIHDEKLAKSLDNLKQQASIWLDPEFFAPPPGAKPDADEGPAAKAQVPSAPTPPQAAPPPHAAPPAGQPADTAKPQ